MSSHVRTSLALAAALLAGALPLSAEAAAPQVKTQAPATTA